MRLKSNFCEQDWGVTRLAFIGAFQAKHLHKAPAQIASTKRKLKWGRRVPRRYMSIIITDVHNFSRRGDASPPFMLALCACVQN